MDSRILWRRLPGQRKAVSVSRSRAAQISFPRPERFQRTFLPIFTFKPAKFSRHRYRSRSSRSSGGTKKNRHRSRRTPRLDSRFQRAGRRKNHHARRRAHRNAVSRCRCERLRRFGAGQLCTRQRHIAPAAKNRCRLARRLAADRKTRRIVRSENAHALPRRNRRPGAEPGQDAAQQYALAYAGYRRSASRFRRNLEPDQSHRRFASHPSASRQISNSRSPPFPDLRLRQRKTIEIHRPARSSRTFRSRMERYRPRRARHGHPYHRPLRRLPRPLRLALPHPRTRRQRNDAPLPSPPPPLNQQTRQRFSPTTIAVVAPQSSTDPTGFNGKLRDKRLNGEISYSLRDAQLVIETARAIYHPATPLR